MKVPGYVNGLAWTETVGAEAEGAARTGNERCDTRLVVDLYAHLRQHGRPSAARVHVLDLSVSGFRIESGLGLEVGTDIQLRLAHMEVRNAVVIWRCGDLAGCAFERPLHPAVLAMLGD